MGEPRELSLLGSLELPDFDGAFWFNKLDDLGIGDLPAAKNLISASGLIDPEEIIRPLPLEEDANDLDHASDDPNTYEPLQDSSRPRQKRRRGRGRSKSNLSVEDRRLKNREIQARYRAKQKREKEHLEATCNQVSQQIEDAKNEQVITRQTNEIMERVLVIRDAAVSILAKGSNQHSSASKDTSQNDETPLITTDGNQTYAIKEMKSSAGSSEITSTGGGGSGSGGVPRPVVQHVYEELSKDAGAPLHSIAEVYDAGKKLEETAVKEIDVKNPHYGQLLVTVRNMTGHQLTESWREFALKLRTIFEAYEEENAIGHHDGVYAPPPRGQDSVNSRQKMMEEIEPLFEEEVLILSIALRHNLPAVQALFSTAGEVPEPMTYWRKVAAKIEVTPKQQGSFRSLFNAYESRLESLKEQRNDMVQSLIQAAGLGSLGTDGDSVGGGTSTSGSLSVNTPFPVDSLHLMMNRYCTLVDAAGSVAATDDNEFSALLALMRATGSVWSLYQKAKLTALAYPSFPDIVHFLKAVATNDGTEQHIGGGNEVPMLEQQ